MRKKKVGNKLSYSLSVGIHLILYSPAYWQMTSGYLFILIFCMSATLKKQRLICIIICVCGECLELSICQKHWLWIHENEANRHLSMNDGVECSKILSVVERSNAPTNKCTMEHWRVFFFFVAFLSDNFSPRTLKSWSRPFVRMDDDWCSICLSMVRTISHNALASSWWHAILPHTTRALFF